jgi:hypothetical protein
MKGGVIKMAKTKPGKQNLADKIAKKIMADNNAMKDLAEEMSGKVVDIIKEAAIGKLITDKAALNRTIKKVLQDEDAVESVADEVGDVLEDELKDKLAEDIELSTKVVEIITGLERFKERLIKELKDDLTD